jgi:hypothetical protein
MAVTTYVIGSVRVEQGKTVPGLNLVPCHEGVHMGK